MFTLIELLECKVDIFSTSYVTYRSVYGTIYGDTGCGASNSFRGICTGYGRREYVL